MPRDSDDEWCDEQLAQGRLDKFKEQWIAVSGATVIGSADTLEQLFKVDAVRDRLDFLPTESEEEKRRKSPLLVYVFGDIVQ